MNQLFLDKALSYLRLGWSVIPVAARTKDQPHVKWEQWMTKAPSADQLTQWARRWPKAELAVITGSISDLVVIDVDSHEYVNDYLLTFQGLTACSRTRKGYHFYFRLPRDEHGAPIPVPTKIRFQRDIEDRTMGVDCKAERAYVMAPPSTHPSGAVYIWERSPEDGIAELPSWLHELILESTGVLEADGLGTHWTEHLLGEIEGTRNDSAAQVIGKMLAESSEELWALYWEAAKSWNKQNVPPMDEKELRTVFDSIANRERVKRQAGLESDRFAVRSKVKRITGDELAVTNYAPVGYGINNFLMEGLTLLVGKPKFGKTYLAMQAAVAVVSGSPFFPRDLASAALGIDLSVNQGPILYLSLEDNERRLKERLIGLGATSSWARKDFEVWFTSPPLFDGGLKEVEDWIKAHRNTRGVFIDPLAAFVAGSTAKKGTSAFQAEYNMIRPIWDLANEYAVPICLVHHARKSSTVKNAVVDPFDSPSGTLGANAAVDTILICDPHPKRNEAHVHGKSRDFGYVDIPLYRNGAGWSILSVPTEGSQEESSGAKTRKKPQQSKETSEAAAQ